ncbi:sensor histidine kinase [Labedaea rhizosphaerae]|uniref:histidine kinase n=1 Tax=Labedaea rhizosphaerae TaxID=598644 RepID=A0A4R6SE95_LABRH|nr:nitrate- and nitrite sensing domain-containing protein [Labedaea rhizosphaerae]TDP98037.1 signal transduction histidine kinase [Labedaea rhizosphaerae]
MLAIVLIPSAALLIIGGGAAGYLVHEGSVTQDWAELTGRSSSIDITNNFVEQFGQERNLSLRVLGGDSSATDQLKKQRGLSDQSLYALFQIGQSGIASNAQAAEATKKANDILEALVKKMPQIRQGVDARQMNPKDVYDYYNSVIDILSLALQGVAATSPDPTAALDASAAADLFGSAESLSRSNALAVGALGQNGNGPGLTNETFQEFAHQVGHYHGMLDMLQMKLTPDEMMQYGQLVKSKPWQQLTSMENAIIARGPGKPAFDAAPLPVPIADWQNAVTQVHAQLLNLYAEHHTHGSNAAYDTGHRNYINSLLGGGAILLVTLIAMFVAIRLSNRLVNRLKRLRVDTLDLADTRLPDIVSRLRRGEQIDVEQEVPPLQYGTDEIGQVAEAFNKAQRTAVAAAAQEAEIQNGVRSVFLNIAHRSQVVVHRQLDVLDKAEREQENPEHLEQLFQLDHLATRARRNAENLLILGGDQPGRQWRNPVPIGEIVRSAVGETEHYKRVTTGRLPDVRMAGSVVADLIHLLAELVDNATSFSPPDSRVEVSGNIVGKGVVIEVEDQGIGLATPQLERINAFLRNPPDFGVMALSEDARLGLFVVSQLAIRHGISVKLIESLYGGVRAIVLVPSASIADDDVNHPRSVPKQVGPAVPEPDHPRRLFTSPNGTTSQDPMVQDDPEMTGRLEGALMTDGEAQQAGHAGQAEPDGRVRRTPSAGRNGDGHTRPGGHQNDGKPALPRRRRQSNLAPQLADEFTAPVADVANMDDTDVVRSAERARNRMLAFQRGTRNGRAGHDPNNW